MLKCPGLFRSDTDGVTNTVSLTKSRFGGCVRDGVVHVNLEQTFMNVESMPIEATYQLPMRSVTAVNQFEVTLHDGRKLVDTTQAALKPELELDCKSHENFSYTIGSLRPGEQVTVAIRYVTVVNNDDGDSLRFVVPTMIASQNRPDSLANAKAEDLAEGTNSEVESRGVHITGGLKSPSQSKAGIFKMLKSYQGVAAAAVFSEGHEHSPLVPNVLDCVSNNGGLPTPSMDSMCEPPMASNLEQHGFPTRSEFSRGMLRSLSTETMGNFSDNYNSGSWRTSKGRLTSLCGMKNSSHSATCIARFGSNENLSILDGKMKGCLNRGQQHATGITSSVIISDVGSMRAPAVDSNNFEDPEPDYSLSSPKREPTEDSQLKSSVLPMQICQHSSEVDKSTSFASPCEQTSIESPGSCKFSFAPATDEQSSSLATSTKPVIIKHLASSCCTEQPNQCVPSQLSASVAHVDVGCQTTRLEIIQDLLEANESLKRENVTIEQDTRERLNQERANAIQMQNTAQDNIPRDNVVRNLVAAIAFQGNLFEAHTRINSLQRSLRASEERREAVERELESARTRERVMLAVLADAGLLVVAYGMSFTCDIDTSTLFAFVRRFFSEQDLFPVSSNYGLL